MDWRWLLFPAVGALIGYGTNYLAVRMLFRPRRPRNVLGWRVQGLIPKRRGEIAVRIGEIVSQDLVSPERLRQTLLRPEMVKPLRRQIKQRVDAFTDQQFEKLPPVIRAVVPDALREGISDAIVREIFAALPELLEKMAAQAKENFNVHGMVVERIRNLDLGHFEQMVLRIARRELRTIEILGGVIGLLVGVAQAALAYFLIS